MGRVALVLALALLAATAPAARAADIVGGQVSATTWPATAQLRVATPAGTLLCGGTLIERAWVLTAAHCVTDDAGALVGAADVSVRLGSAKLGVGGTVHAVAQVAREPGYDPLTLAGDAALVRLAAPAAETPLALVGADALWAQEPGRTARVLGWGTTSEGGSVSADLREVDVPIVDDDTCGAPAAYGAELIRDVMLCAGLAAGGKDACQGDSGGPLMVDTGAGAGAGAAAEGWKLAGIVSAGDGCARPGKYGIYTELANTRIRSWIYATVAGVPLGPRNASFEAPLDAAADWDAAVYAADGTVVREGAGACPDDLAADEARRRVCRVGTDTFMVRDPGAAVDREVVVAPLDGGAMLRLGGPFHDAGQAQPRDRDVARQTFVVDPADPVLRLNTNLFSFDAGGADELRVRARLYDEDGDVVLNRVVASSRASDATMLVSTGWRSASVDLAPLAGRRVTLRLDFGGTGDELRGSWAYVDAGTAPPVVGAPGAPDAPANVHVQQDPATGWKAYIFTPAEVAAAGACLPLRLGVPIAGAVGDVSLALEPASGGAAQQVALADGDGDGVWTAADGLCVAAGTLSVAYSAAGQRYVVAVGAVVVADPQGKVYDKDTLAPLAGATVTLQRRVGGAFATVLPGDPAVAPAVNPAVTADDGAYGWDLAAGTYRVVVTRAGYETTVAPLGDVALARRAPPVAPPVAAAAAADPGPATATLAPALPAASRPAAPRPPSRTSPCARKKGRALRACLLTQRRRAALAKCRRKHGRARVRCERAARAIGRPKPRKPQRS